MKKNNIFVGIILYLIISIALPFIIRNGLPFFLQENYDSYFTSEKWMFCGLCIVALYLVNVYRKRYTKREVIAKVHEIIDSKLNEEELMIVHQLNDEEKAQFYEFYRHGLNIQQQEVITRDERKFKESAPGLPSMLKAVLNVILVGSVIFTLGSTYDQFAQSNTIYKTYHGIMVKEGEYVFDHHTISVPAENEIQGDAMLEYMAEIQKLPVKVQSSLLPTKFYTPEAFQALMAQHQIEVSNAYVNGHEIMIHTESDFEVVPYYAAVAYLHAHPDALNETFQHLWDTTRFDIELPYADEEEYYEKIETDQGWFFVELATGYFIDGTTYDQNFDDYFEQLFTIEQQV